MHPEARLVTSDFWHPGSRASLFQPNRRRPRTDNLGGDGSRELEHRVPSGWLLVTQYSILRAPYSSSSGRPFGLSISPRRMLPQSCGRMVGDACVGRLEEWNLARSTRTPKLREALGAHSCAGTVRSGGYGSKSTRSELSGSEWSVEISDSSTAKTWGDATKRDDFDSPVVILPSAVAALRYVRRPTE